MIYDYESIATLLAAELRRRVQSNPSYSLRSFARNLHLSPGALSEILKGRRELSLRSVSAVAKAIGLNASEAKHLLRLAQNAKAEKAGEHEILKGPNLNADQRILSEQIFSLVSEWYHFAILNLLECEDFKWSAVWISSRLGISRIQAQMAMDLLLRLRMVEMKSGRYQGTSEHVVSSSEIPSEAIRKYHQQILNKASVALEAQAVAEREFSGIGLALDAALIPAIKKEIAEFQDRLIGKYSRGKKRDVYFMEVAFFKLTQGDQKS